MVMPEQPPTEAPFWKGTAAVRKRSARKQHSFSPPMLSWVSQLVLSTLRSLLKNNPKPQLIKEHVKGAWCRQSHASKGRSQCCGMWGRAAVGTGGQRRGSCSALACFGFCRKKKSLEQNTDRTPKGCRPVLVRWLQENQFVKPWVVISTTALPEQTYGLLNWGLKVIRVVRKIRMPLS